MIPSLLSTSSCWPGATRTTLGSNRQSRWSKTGSGKSAGGWPSIPTIRTTAFFSPPFSPSIRDTRTCDPQASRSLLTDTISGSGRALESATFPVMPDSCPRTWADGNEDNEQSAATVPTRLHFRLLCAFIGTLLGLPARVETLAFASCTERCQESRAGAVGPPPFTQSGGALATCGRKPYMGEWSGNFLRVREGHLVEIPRPKSRNQHRSAQHRPTRSDRSGGRGRRAEPRVQLPRDWRDLRQRVTRRPGPHRRTEQPDM